MLSLSFFRNHFFFFRFFLTQFNRAASPNNHTKRQHPNQDLWFRFDPFTVESICIIDKSIQLQHTNNDIRRSTSAAWQCYRFGFRTGCWQSIQFRIKTTADSRPLPFFSGRRKTHLTILIFVRTGQKNALGEKTEIGMNDVYIFCLFESENVIAKGKHTIN